MAKNQLKQDLQEIDSKYHPAGEEKQQPLVEFICQEYKIDTLAGRQFVRHALANALLMNRKQKDYGPNNISSFLTTGVIIRLSDKMERLKNLFNGGRRRKAVNESIEDNLRDVGNYGIIGQMCETGDWPNE